MNPGYLAEIERAFLALAGRGLMLSAADVALVDQWHRAGIPAEVVLSGLAAAFERPQSRPTRVRGLAFARRSVEDAMEAYRSRQVGSAPVVPEAAAAGERPAELLRARLAALAPTSPALLELVDLLRRRVAAWSAEASYDDIAMDWVDLLSWAEEEGWARLGPEVKGQIDASLDALLAQERRRAAPEHYAQTREVHRRRLVREHLGLPSPTDLDARA